MNIERNNIVFIKGENDEAKLKSVRQLAAKTKETGFRRQVCFQLTHQQLLRQLQTQDMDAVIAQKLELHPYSFEQLWAQHLFVSLPNRPLVNCPLDWIPITYTSDQRVHMVVFELNAMAEALIQQACLICHYPNYLRDQRLKTCITIVDPKLKEDDNLLLRRYGTLLNNCHWRFIDHRGCAHEHIPDTAYLGGEYVDIEFQLVAASPHSVVTRVLLTELAKQPHEMPSILFAGEDSERNWDLATGLPVEYYLDNCHIPIYARMKSTAMLGSDTMMPQYRNVKAFGMDDCQFDCSLPLTQLAIGVAYLYDYCYRTGDVHCPHIDRDEALAIWHRTFTLNRFSSEINAMTIMTKLRSLDKSPADTLTERDVEILSEVEHNRWSVEKLLAGIRPVTSDEQAAIDADRSLKQKMKERGAHYDLRPYEALKADFNGHNVQRYDEVLVRGLQTIIRHFEQHDIGAKLVVVNNEEPTKKHHWINFLKWGSGSLLALLLLLMVGNVYLTQHMDELASQQLSDYVYKLQIDSIEVWNGSNGIDTVLHPTNGQANIIGTAFSLHGVGILTARHCVEYWLYDNLNDVNNRALWTPEMRLASDVETYNDTTHSAHKRMVAICSLLTHENKVYRDRVVFSVDQSHDQVRTVGSLGHKWRYVVPVFRRDREMLKSDLAIFHTPSEKGISTCDNTRHHKGTASVLGYANSESRILVAKTMKIIERDSILVGLDGEVSKGVSGGPVVVWSRGGFRAIGVMSHNDQKKALRSWATIMDKKRVQ